MQAKRKCKNVLSMWNFQEFVRDLDARATTLIFIPESGQYHHAFHFVAHEHNKGECDLQS